MILTSTTESVPFTPAWKTDQPNAPVFHLRAGSVIERGQLEAELSGPYRAGRVYGFELREAMVGGVSTLLADDPEQGRVLELIHAEQSDEAPEPLSDEDAALLAEIRKVLAEHWSPYRDLLAQLERRRELAPILTFRRFCTGWDGALDADKQPVPFARGRDGQVSEAALAKLTPLDITAAGNAAYGMLYGVDQEGNSARGASSESAPPTSRSDAPSTEGGTSAGSGGPKTPGSRSRRKS